MAAAAFGGRNPIPPIDDANGQGSSLSEVAMATGAHLASRFERRRANLLLILMRLALQSHVTCMRVLAFV